jgi:hypothetical protein
VLPENKTYHLCQTPSCDDVSRMHKSIQMPRRFLDLFPHIIIAIEVEDVGYEVECILVVLDLRVKAGQIEAIGEVLFVYFAKVFVSS